MAAATIFGLLSGLGNLGQQKGQADQIVNQEVLRRIQLQQQVEAARTQRQEAAARIRESNTRQDIQRQQLAAGRQPVMVGQAYTASDGKQYARFQDPLTGALSVQPLPGNAPETPEEQMARGLRALGFSDADVQSTVKQKYGGRPLTEKREVQPDKNSPTGWSAVYMDPYGTEQFRTETAPPRYLTPTETSGTSKDNFGNVTTHTSIRRPLVGGLSDSGSVAASTAQTPQGGGTAPSRGASTPASRDGGAASGVGPPSGPALTNGTVSVGPYRGLDAQGQISPDPRINDSVREFANQILNGADANKIPAKARGPAESLARKFGWKGQGSLTPAQQMQIEQVDQSLQTLSKMSGVFNSKAGRLYMSTVPLDPTSEGGAGGLRAALQRGLMTQQQYEYLNALTRLRGVITGIRGFTGANNSNATADRLLAELPNFTNTKNSADAQDKLQKIRQELSIIKRLGYFLPEAPGKTAPDANPMGLDLPGGA